MEDDKKTVEEKPVEEKPAEEKPIDEKKIYGVIYVIINLINGKKYVGQTTRTIEQRFQEHAKTDSVIGKAIRKHGEENFKTEILEECYSAEELNIAENKWIKELDCKVPNGYNVIDGGIFTEKHRNNITNSNKGREMTQKTRNKIADTLRGRKLSIQHRANISAGKKGKKKTKKTRRKMSDYAKNRPPLHNQRIAESLKGTRNGAGNKGRVWSQKVKDKIAASVRDYFAKKILRKKILRRRKLQKILAKKCLNRQ